VAALDLPEDIRRLADARQAAREARDFDEADRLKGLIEEAGWKVTDQRTSFRLARAQPADVVEPDGRVRYGWSGAVPAVIADAPRGLASVVVIAPEDADQLERFLATLAGTIADDVQRVVVANGLGPEAETLLARLATQWTAEAATGGEDSFAAADVETVWMVGRVGAAAALNAGIRRAIGPIVTLLDARVEAVGDFVMPLVGSFEDRTVAVAGPWGYVSDDMRRFEPVSVAEVGRVDVAAVDLAAMAFRRSDYLARGPLDEQFMEPALLDAWWSFVLRDPDEHEMTPRRAVLVDVPLVPAERDRPEAAPGSPADRIVRRNRYRIIDTFGGRRDLAVPRVEIG
jgi:hypothetical protein